LKLILVIGLGIILSYFVYNNKIKSTIERVQKINQLNESTDNNEASLNAQIETLLTEEKEVEKALSSNNSSSFESYLIDEITQFNSKIEITNVSDLYQYTDGDYSISSLYLTLKNDYKTTLKLIDYIEKELKTINVISIEYYSKKIKFNSSKKHLYATLYIQNIKNN
jgi:uncharacterized protein HemX